MSNIEKEVHPLDQRSSASFANAKGTALHEETAHEAAERGMVATDKYVDQVQFREPFFTYTSHQIRQCARPLRSSCREQATIED